MSCGKGVGLESMKCLKAYMKSIIVTEGRPAHSLDLSRRKTASIVSFTACVTECLVLSAA
jgi:hypothetical protein